jgi:hypothetical protein
LESIPGLHKRLKYGLREVKTEICEKEINATGSAETLIGWKSGKATYVPYVSG